MTGVEWNVDVMDADSLRANVLRLLTSRNIFARTFRLLWRYLDKLNVK